MLFVVIAYFRRLRYARSSSPAVPVPVVVVGNISVGGTGKTPVIVALAHFLLSKGYHPGIITRGYGVHIEQSLMVELNADPATVGDEPLFIRQATDCPVAVGRDRIASARCLLKSEACDIILSDDGLQHYPLFRDVEIAVVDAQRQLGNGWRLPVGPLREPRQRLQEVDFVFVNGEHFTAPWLPTGKTFFAEMKPKQWRNVKTGRSLALSELNIQNATAIAGIGNPQRFFTSLRAMGFKGECQAFSDHHSYTAKDLNFAEGVVLMTEKDAVKCKEFAKDDWWALAIELPLDETLLNQIERKIQSAK